MSYKVLSIIQVVFICLTAFSVLDYGYVLTTSEEDGLIFNKIMFDTTDGIVGEILKDIDFWGMLQFWAYCFFIVAICQLIKAFTVEK